MKKYIYSVLFIILLLISFNVYFSAKQHVDVVKVADELVVKSDSLTSEVKVLTKVKDSAMSRIEMLDSTILSKDSVITKQFSDIRGLKLDTAKLKKVSTIVIRDTVYITESKNFWGKKKKTVESSSSVDSVETNEPETDSLKTN